MAFVDREIRRNWRNFNAPAVLCQGGHRQRQRENEDAT
jgi:hypothetical protein